MPGSPETRRYLQMMTRFSSAFALLSDVSMFVIGGSLKRREKISARLGDILSLLYIASATIKRYHDEGRQKDDRPLLDWAMYDTFFRLQVAIDGVLDNFPNRFVAAWLRMLVFPKGLTLNAPFDKVGAKVATILHHARRGARSPDRGRLHPARRERRDRAPRVRDGSHDQGRSHRGEDAQAARRRASSRSARSPSAARPPLAQGIITQEEHDHLDYTDRLRRDVIKVDDFEHDLARGAKPQEDSWQADSKKKVAAASMSSTARAPRSSRRERASGPSRARDLAVNAGRALLLRQPFEAERLRRGDRRRGDALGRRGQHRRASCRCAWVAATRCRRGP